MKKYKPCELKIMIGDIELVGFTEGENDIDMYSETELYCIKFAKHFMNNIVHIDNNIDEFIIKHCLPYGPSDNEKYLIIYDILFSGGFGKIEEVSKNEFSIKIDGDNTKSGIDELLKFKFEY